MADETGLVIILLGFFAGIILIFSGFRWLKKKKIVEEIPTSKIRSIAMGLVEVKGKAKAVKEQHALLTGRKCCYYAYKVYKRYTGKNRKQRQVIPITKGKSEEPFYIHDATGKVMVEAKDAQILHSTWTIYKGKEHDNIIKKLLKHGVIQKKDLEDKWYAVEVSEGIIKEGDEFYVLGEAKDNPYVREGTAHHGVEDIIITKGGEYPLMVSRNKEWEILNSLKNKAIAAISAGAILSVLFAIMMFAYFALQGG